MFLGNKETRTHQELACSDGKAKTDMDGPGERQADRPDPVALLGIRGP